MTMQFRQSLLAAAVPALFALTACSMQNGPPVPIGGAGAANGPTTAQTRNYLYLAFHSPGLTQEYIDRFRLVNGLPSATPDRTYSGYGPLMAVAGNGTL
ncbi:MAG TPA: hypothetical protein VGF86_06245 [Candidatus Tumulicola sp.]|jgi:hypothetical protein